MAVKENQGLQIAVMIFFLLVVLLAVTTYVFFKSADEAVAASKTKDVEVAEARKQAISAQDEINKFKGFIGFAAEDTLETVEAEVTKDMEKFSVGYVADDDKGKPTYRTLLEYLHNDKIAIRQSEVEAKDSSVGLLARIEKVEGDKDKQIVEFKESVEKVTTDLEGERGKFNEDRNRVTQTSAGFEKQLQAKSSEITDLQKKTAEQITKLQSVITKQQAQIQSLTKEREKEASTASTDQPNGRITWVNQKANVVWVNLGESDGLKRQTTFAVYPGDGTGGALTDKKGSIEITRIINENMAEARIVTDQISNPILPGDNIHSPVWKRGYREGFALAGLMDLDGDGLSDREKVRDLIALNGGDIDAEVLDNGKMVGKLKITTRYVILGAQPTGLGADTTLLDSYSALTGEAQKMGVESIAVQKFVSRLGWSPDERTIKLGKGANPDDHKANVDTIRKAPGATSEVFKERSKPKSAF